MTEPAIDPARLWSELMALASIAASGRGIGAAHEMRLARFEGLRCVARRHQPRWDHSIGKHRDVLPALDTGHAKAVGAAMARHVHRTGASARDALTALA